MGLLSQGSPLSWEETQRHADHVRRHGILQFLHIYHAVKDRHKDVLKWGDEVSAPPPACLCPARPAPLPALRPGVLGRHLQGCARLLATLLSVSRSVSLSFVHSFWEVSPSSSKSASGAGKGKRAARGVRASVRPCACTGPAHHHLRPPPAVPALAIGVNSAKWSPRLLLLEIRSPGCVCWSALIQVFVKLCLLPLTAPPPPRTSWL
jgi:hypothetical protein